MAASRDIPLSRRLVLITAGLLAVGLAAGTIAMTFVLHNQLKQVIDDELDSIVDRINVTGIFDTEATVPASFRDDFVLIRHIPQKPPEILRSEGTPEHWPIPDLTGVDITSTEKMTVLSTDPHGPSWRILNRAVVSEDGVQLGHATVALSLRTVDKTLSEFTAWVTMVDLVIIAIGAVLAYMLVKQSLRPLREIERTAGAIAAGDLSQRVTPGPAQTETGSLANSLNAMLSHIERSFETQRKSEERMRRFVSDASHELRTPLATVQGYGELYRLGGIPPEELPGAIGRIESEAQRMSGLVADLLQLARLDEGHPMRHTSIDLTRLAADAVGDVKALDTERSASVIALDGGAPGPVIAIADEDRIRQVLSNLIGNAVQHTPAGTAVDIAVGTQNDQAIIEVRDHGPGVPEEHLSRIFGRFHRVDTSRSRASGGTGLGLAIVAAIAQAHHGSVSAHDTPGGGLTIRITIPLAGGNGMPALPPT